ncbi:MAG: rod shape-determining protein MreD [Acidimicrobiia bacterium]
MRSILDSVALRTALVAIVVLILQLTLVPNMQIAGASADLMLLFALAAATTAGPDVGAKIAFVYGLVFDLMLQTPFGLSALVYALAAYMFGGALLSISRTSWRVTALSVALATAAAVGLYALLARVFGEPWMTPGRMVRVMLVEAAFNVFLAPIAVKVSEWTTADLTHRPAR